MLSLRCRILRHADAKMQILASKTVKQCLIFLEMYNKTIIEFESVITLTSTFNSTHRPKNSTNNCL